MGNEASQFGKKIENDVKINWVKESVQCPFVPREGQAAAVVGSKMYLFGGVTLLSDDAEESIMETDELIIYDSNLKKWSKENYTGDCPGQRSGATMVGVKHNLYLFGGLSQLSGWLNDVFVYNTETKVWREVVSSNGPSPRDKIASVAIGDKMYVFGGFGPVPDDEADVDILPDDGDDEYEDLDELQEVRNCQDAANFTWSNHMYIFDTITEEWSCVTNNGVAVTPTPRAAHTLSLIKNKTGKDYLFMFGGRDAQSRKNDLWKFDVSENVWEECKGLGCPPEPRSFHAAASAEHRLVVYGGRGTKDQHFNDLHIYDTESNEWLQPGCLAENDDIQSILPPAVGLHSLVATKTNLIMFGGSSELDPATGTCIKVFNDIYVIPVDQLLFGGSIKPAKEEVDELKKGKPVIPGLVELKPNDKEGNISDT